MHISIIICCYIHVLFYNRDLWLDQWFGTPMIDLIQWKPVPTFTPVGRDHTLMGRCPAKSLLAIQGEQFFLTDQYLAQFTSNSTNSAETTMLQFQFFVFFCKISK